MAGITLGYSVLDFVSKSLTEVPKLTFTYVQQEMQRHVKRFRKRMLKERFRGPPGIDLPSGRGMKIFTKGRSLSDLRVGAVITKTLIPHEYGATITAKGGGYLFLRRGPRGQRRTEIFAKVRSVTIPARLHFRATWESMIPDARLRIQNAMNRALKVSSERQLARAERIVVKAVA